jgi:AbrB family looped-hinge helix DNA binding protein
MKTIITMNEQGRLTVPAAAREALHLEGASHLELEVTEDALILRPTVVVPRDDSWAYEPDHIRRVNRAREEYRQRGGQPRTEADLERLANE